MVIAQLRMSGKCIPDASTDLLLRIWNDAWYGLIGILDVDMCLYIAVLLCYMPDQGIVKFY